MLPWNKDPKKDSHFRPINEEWGGASKPCPHPEHRPPSHLFIPPGQEYVHVCPHCRNQQVICPVQITMGSTKMDEDGTTTTTIPGLGVIVTGSTLGKAPSWT